MFESVMGWCVGQIKSDPKFVISIVVGIIGILVSYHYGKARGISMVQRQRQKYSSGGMEQEQYQETK